MRPSTWPAFTSSQIIRCFCTVPWKSYYWGSTVLRGRRIFRHQTNHKLVSWPELWRFANFRGTPRPCCRLSPLTGLTGHQRTVGLASRTEKTGTWTWAGDRKRGRNLLKLPSLPAPCATFPAWLIILADERATCWPHLLRFNKVCCGQFLCLVCSWQFPATVPVGRHTVQPNGACIVT